MIIDDNGSFYRIPTEWMAKHDARLRAEVITECINKLEECYSQKECIDALEQLKEQHND